MSSAVQKTSKYTYRSTNGGNADVSIEYSADLSALSRLEVKKKKKIIQIFKNEFAKKRKCLEI